MTINREKLISLLVEKTGMDRKNIEQQLDDLTSRIMDAANRGKALEIKGFGLFYFDEDGNLAFKASDQLDSEINFAHAGMEPVELSPAKTGSDPASKDDNKPEDDEKDTAEEESDPDDVFGIRKTLAGTSDENDSEDSAPLGNLFRGESPDTKPEPKSKEAATKTGTAPAKKPQKQNTPKRKPAAKSRDPMNTIIVVVLAAVLLFAAYFVFTEYLNAPEQTASQTAEQQTLVPENPPAATERDITESAEPEDPEPVQVPESENEPEPLDDTIDEVTTTDPYGLYGELADTQGDLFTIVVHSLRDRGVADRTADELRQDGFRISVNERIVDGQTYYRVGIGQFPTIREAQQEATTLPDPFNNQNFIQRIQ